MSDPFQSKNQASDVERGSHDSQPDGNPKGMSAKLRSCYGLLPQPIRNTLNQMSEKFDIEETTWGCRLYIAAYLIVVLTHPLHYYAYVIKREQCCLEIDDEIYATIAIVLFFNAYMLLHTPNFIRKLFKTGPRYKTMKYHFCFTQIPVLLMTLTVLPDLTRGNENRIFLTTANLFLFGYILLVIGLSLTIKNAIENKSDSYLAQAKWGKAVYNLFLYLLGGHVYGALWYSLAIDRVLACWREDYFSRNHFKPDSFVCRYKDKNRGGELNCPKLNNIGTENNEFGIFSLALQSGILYLKGDFAKKFVYCLRWGLQALSCFGQNLLPSTFILENIFVVSVIIYSTVLFVFLIGNMQTYLHSNSKESEYMIKKMKMQDRLQCLKDVQELNDWGDSKLNKLCHRIKPVSYGEGTLIVREGEPISEVLFMLKGKLRTCTSTATDHGNGGNVKTFGKELVRWIQDHPQSISLPISSSTIKAVENVEAFALTADDLADVWVNIQNNH